MLDSIFYEGREQTFVKHFVLEHYLERLAFKVGWHGSSINYIDGFAGPWKQEDEALRDTSPFIALDKLRACRAALIARGRKPIEIRCLFIERNAASYALLERETRSASIPGVIAEAKQGDFEALTRHILKFASGGYRPFTFFFIDPTGWTGYGMSKLETLFNRDRSEILINFMTKDIKRFVDDDEPNTVASFHDLFGISNYRERWHGLQGIDREDAIVATYCQRLRDVGNYPYVAASVVLHPTDSRTHYHLVYGTRHPAGLRVFRDVERAALLKQQEVRSVAQQRRRVQRTGQFELYSDDDGQSNYIEQLRDHYHSSYQGRLVRAMANLVRFSYDDFETMALAHPMTSLMDLHHWLIRWKVCGKVAIEGLRGRAHLPQYGRGHYLVWKG